MSKSNKSLAPVYSYLVNEDNEILSDASQENMYNQMLDECYGAINICGYPYEASSALKSVDPIAYRCGFADFWSQLLEDGYTEVFMTTKEANKLTMI